MDIPTGDVQRLGLGPGWRPGRRGRPRMGRRERRRVLENILLISPQLILFTLLVLVPLIAGVPLLFTDRSSFMDPDVRYVGFENLTRIFTDRQLSAVLLPAIGRTAQFTLFNYLMVYAIGLPLALLMYEIGFRGGFFSIVYLPRMISALALGYMAIALFAESTGSVNLFLLERGWIERPINIKVGNTLTIGLPIFVGWKTAGYNMAIFLAGLLSIPRETIEAAIVDGASYWRRLIHIYFPQMSPSFIIVTIFCLTGSFQTFDLLLPMGALTGNREAEFVSIVFYKYAFSTGRMALGMALSVQVLLPLVFVAIGLQRLQKRLSYEV